MISGCRNNIRSMLAGACMLCLVLSSGCGGCSSSGPDNLSKEERDERVRAALQNALEEAPPPPRAPKTAGEPAKAPPQTGRAAQPNVRSAGRTDIDEEEVAASRPAASPTNATATRPGAAQRPVKPSRPQDLAQWKLEYFVSAKGENDPRLLPAIEQLGHPSIPERAPVNIAILASLLKLLSGEPAAARVSTDDEQSPQLGGSNVKIAQAIVLALATIGTSDARQLIEQLVLGGKVDSQIALAALKTLLDHPSPENENLILRVLTERQEGSAFSKRDASVPRTMALKYVKEKASESLRTRLAKQATAADTPETSFKEVWDCLKERREENLAAQIVFYQSNQLDDRGIQSLEQAFSVESRAALAALLRVPSPNGSSRRNDAAVATKPSHVAEYLWHEKFVVTLERRLRAVDRLEKNANLLIYATTIPHDTIRAIVCDTLEKHWEEGPKSLAPLVDHDGTLAEPGFLLAVKQLPRRSSAGANGNAKSGGDTSKSAGGKAAKIAAAREIKQRQDEVAQRWLNFSEDLVQTMCRHFYAAARNQLERNSTSTSELDAERLGFKLRSDATIVATYAVDWPNEVDKSFGKVNLSPLKVRYVRVEQKARPMKLLAYYRRQLPSCEEHKHEQGAWLDGSRKEKGGKISRSVDVLITKPNTDVPILLDQEQPLVADILIIECTQGSHEDAKSDSIEAKHVDSRG